mmetsp:Transcript_1756/g.3752  ORF Transcript_1756/g.3752 Transcript_1756/m.3752 type:complete len:539 (-) Transcript_1756:21-1637(-)
MRRCTLTSSIVFVSAVTTLFAHSLPTHHLYLRVRNSLPTNNQHAQWKIKRKLVEKGDWDEDDDDDLPFHVQDDDATNIGSQAQITVEENESETYLERYNDGLNENSAKIEEETMKKEEGIVFSDSAGDKEAEEEQDVPLPPPPPPPLPSTENSTVSEDKEQPMAEQKSTFNEKESVHNTTTQSHATDSKHNKHENKQQPTQDESKTADTIFDDLLRGFTFAATFCALIVCIYKFCGYACVKCGIFPDERVMRARWRRSRLKKKRAYGDSNVVPPLDTRKWAEWSAKRGRVNGGVWDSGFDDIENNNGGSRDDGSEAGAIVFDNSGIEMAEWEEDGNDSGVETELEFGEGEELEDKSHDSRLFDADDDGKGVDKEANKFFESQSKKKVPTEKTTKKKKKNALDNPDSNMKSKVDDNVDKVDATPLFNASFDALDPPSGDNGLGSKPDSDGGVDSSSSAAKEFLLEVSNGEHRDLDTKKSKVQEGDQQADEGDNSFESADDRGYDEDADLLGLRSDSPPPLDLEEIEKNLVENMNNAKFY